MGVQLDNTSAGYQIGGSSSEKIGFFGSAPVAQQTLVLTGTVTDDTAEAVKAVKAGRVDFKLDKSGNVAVPLGKASFEPNMLIENAEAVIEAVNSAKPASSKGVYLVTGTIAATMSPGVKLDMSPFRKN